MSSKNDKHLKKIRTRDLQSREKRINKNKPQDSQDTGNDK